jgi:hypothetical protein
LETRKSKTTKLTFVIYTYDEWDEAGIAEIANEFQNLYGGNMAIDAAYLEKAETSWRWLCPECGSDNGPFDANCGDCGEGAPEDVVLEGGS